MKILRETELLVEKKTAGIIASGNASCRDARRMHQYLARSGSATELLFVGAQHKDPAELSALQREFQDHDKQLPPTRKNQIRRKFVHREEHLGGRGREFRKRPDIAIQELAQYSRNVRALAEWVAEVMDTSGGVELLFQLLSSGGHIVAQKLLELELAARMTSRPFVVDSIIRPPRSDAAAELIYVEQMRFLLQNALSGADLLVMRDSDRARTDRDLQNHDRMATGALMAPLSARRTKTRVPAVEAYEALARKGAVVGIWAVPVRFETFNVGSLLWARQVKDRTTVVDQLLQAIEALIEDERTSLSGIPAARDAENIFAVAGNIGRQTFEIVEAEAQRHGPVLFVPAPFRRIYVSRMANIDVEALAADLGISTTGQVQLAASNGHNVEWAFGELSHRFSIQDEVLRSPWKRRVGS